VAVKVQVASGGRGKAGGVLRADDAAAAEAAAQKLFAQRFGGETPRALLIEPWVAHEREMYLALTIDVTAGGYVVLYSPRGGVEVESQAPLQYAFGSPRAFRAHALREVLAQAEPDGGLRERLITLTRRMLYLATAVDAMTVEINPLTVVDGRLLALDAKIVRDEAAAFRHADLEEEIEAARKREPKGMAKALEGNLMMVWLDGEVGLISGGAGMTMAAMDMIADAGAKPACFLDCSSNPTPAGYQLAFGILDREPQVKAILFSIFGGGTQIDRVARTLHDILKTRKSKKPVVIRMNGTGRDACDAYLKEAGLVNHPSLESAVAEVVEKSKARARAA
jgi:succinyl-CoA synthetase beta subunit